MLQNIKKNNKGFTIIEVLIVLAIAGLIMLIVFLAVPALRRNSNNQAARNDASKVLAAVSEAVSNGGGALPGSTADATNLETAANTKQNVIVVDKIDKVEKSVLDQVQIVKQVKCKEGATNTTGAMTALTADKNDDLVEAGTSRQYVILYQVEAANGTYTNQCLAN